MFRLGRTGWYERPSGFVRISRICSAGEIRPITPARVSRIRGPTPGVPIRKLAGGTTLVFDTFGGSVLDPATGERERDPSTVDPAGDLARTPPLVALGGRSVCESRSRRAGRWFSGCEPRGRGGRTALPRPAHRALLRDPCLAGRPVSAAITSPTLGCPRRREPLLVCRRARHRRW